MSPEFDKYPPGEKNTLESQDTLLLGNISLLDLLFTIGKCPESVKLFNLL